MQSPIHFITTPEGFYTIAKLTFLVHLILRLAHTALINLKEAQ